jgi:hypothetical protein
MQKLSTSRQQRSISKKVTKDEEEHATSLQRRLSLEGKRCHARLTISAEFCGSIPAYFPAAILSQTCQKDFISSGWPSETRAKVSMGGNGRPIRILFFLK